MRIALCQLNVTVGDLSGNLARMEAAYREAAARGATLAVFSELVTTGYPPLDLLDRPGFVSTAIAASEAFAAITQGGPAAIWGGVTRNQAPTGRPLVNAAYAAADGRLVARHGKALLPTYDVFDEARWFAAATPQDPVMVDGARVALTVCEDLWLDADPECVAARYAVRPVDAHRAKGFDLLVNISASPFSVGKDGVRLELLRRTALTSGRPVAYVNQVGGNDALIFDGRSRLVSATGEVLAEAPAFAEGVVLGALDGPATPPAPADAIADLHAALVLGLRDYFHKTGAPRRAVLGLSGGIDSAVTAALAVDALGPANVVGLLMPSEFSSAGSLADAHALAEQLGLTAHVLSIQPLLDAARAALTPLLGSAPQGTTDENLQARLRGQTLMAFSNTHGHLVLSTGNKSELAVGYATLFGDLCGALSVLGDVYKTDVYRLARWLNRDRVRIPWASIDKPPSAELRPEQRDDDSLPPYEVLDRVLAGLIDQAREPSDLKREGADAALVDRVARMVDHAEFKRRQAATVLRVSGKAFGSGRRLPIAQGWTRDPRRSAT